ncbi:MAG: ABC transporter ATP-binding protein [Muribaculaceae bacterium]|nr:ABC transporter ATP-binding protein [Muribaculaceae bacterium]
MAHAIELRDFSIGHGSRILIRNVSTEFASGTLTALIGRNGSGKSTLLRALGGLDTRYSGDIFIEGEDLRTLSALRRARLLALVTTERTRIAAMRCEDVVATGRAPHTGWAGRLSAYDRERVAAALAAVGMTAYAQRTMDTMSDGECQRVMIARALAQDTPVLLLDEPTSFLDMPSRYELASLLGSLAREQGKCVIFSTHELDIAVECCDMVALVAEETLTNLPPDRMTVEGHIDRLFKKTITG